MQAPGQVSGVGADKHFGVCQRNTRVVSRDVPDLEMVEVHQERQRHPDSRRRWEGETKEGRGGSSMEIKEEEILIEGAWSRSFGRGTYLVGPGLAAVFFKGGAMARDACRRGGRGLFGGGAASWSVVPATEVCCLPRVGGDGACLGGRGLPSAGLVGC